MDLSTNVSSKKHVDFNDARYQMADKLKQNHNKNIRAAFTLYDNKERDKVAVQEISAAYALSDKKLAIGELLNKMVDLIIDMEDGVLDTEKDAVYAWKYSVALLQMYDDKKKRQESLNSFDNSLKNAVTNSKVFIDRYPGKYTARTNFFDSKTKNELITNIIDTFNDVALPKIHDSAIKQSREIAEKHNNPILDKIVRWAVENYNCKADSFFAIEEDKETGLFYSVNTVILHLKNGYDMSIVGNVGTDRDDKFAISIFNANDITISKHGERINQDDIQNALSDASDNDPIDPLSKLLEMEKKKNAVLIEQYDILSAIRPMIKADVLQLKAAESVVGKDYIWGCQQWRANHDELPEDFKLEDVVLPVFEDDTTDETIRQQELASDINKFTDSIDAAVQDNNASIPFDANMQIEAPPQITDIKETDAPAANNEPAMSEISLHLPTVEEKPSPILTATLPDDLFATEKPKVEEKKFGEKDVEYRMPKLNLTKSQAPKTENTPVKEKKFDVSSTLLPGVVIKKKKEVVDESQSITAKAQPMPKVENDISIKWKDAPNNTPAIQKQDPKLEDKQSAQPELVLDDLDALFD